MDRLVVVGILSLGLFGFAGGRLAIVPLGVHLADSRINAVVRRSLEAGERAKARQVEVTLGARSPWR